MLVLDAENIYSDSLQASQQLFLLYTVPFLLDYTNPLNFSSSSGSLILPVPLKFISPHFLQWDLKKSHWKQYPQNILSALLRVPSTTHINHGIFSKHFKASRHTRLLYNREQYLGKRHHSLFNSSSTQRMVSSGDKEHSTSPEVKSQAGYLPFQVAHNHSHNASRDLPDTSVTPDSSSGSWALCHTNATGFKCFWIARGAITELWFTAALLESPC